MRPVLILLTLLAGSCLVSGCDGNPVHDSTDGSLATDAEDISDVTDGARDCDVASGAVRTFRKETRR